MDFSFSKHRYNKHRFYLKRVRELDYLLENKTILLI